MTKSILAWHFAQPDKRLRYGDGRVIRVGDTHSVQGVPRLCKFGLHASIRPIDALDFADSSILFRVRLSGTIIESNDKCVATSRTYLAELDAELVLGEFARKCAAAMLHLWRAPQVVKDWLKTGDPALKSAAWSAAERAAWSAAWSAACSAAERAAWSAAWSAACSAACSAAERAARSAARSAACSAARSAAERAAWSAAESAAERAAWSAARSAQNKMLLAALKAEKDKT